MVNKTNDRITTHEARHVYEKEQKKIYNGIGAVNFWRTIKNYKRKYYNKNRKRVKKKYSFSIKVHSVYRKNNK